jgi:type III secretion protein V
LQVTPIVPIAVAVCPQLAPLVDPNTAEGARLQSALTQLRSSLYYDIGVLLPQAYAFMSPPIQPDTYLILIKEVLIDQGTIKPDCLFINDSSENVRIFGLEGEDVTNPADLRPGAWIPAHQRHLAEAAGLKIWEPGEIIPLHLSRILKRCAHEFIGLQEAQTYLNSLASSMPALVAEVIPKAVPLHQFTDVLQRLSQEGISIRDLKSILDALNDWGRIEKDPVMLTEYVRTSLKRYITYRHAAGHQTLYVYLLDPEIEDVIGGAIRRTATGSFLSLDPALSQEILNALRREISSPAIAAQKPVILTDMEIRRYVKKMVELEFPYLAVLSYQELTPELNVQPIARISMRSPQLPHSMGQPEEPAALVLKEG